MQGTQTFSIKVFNREIARVEIAREFGVPGPERSGARPVPKKLPEMSIHQDLIAPLLVDSYVSLMGLVPDAISLDTEHSIEVNGNIDSSTACSILKGIKRMDRDSVTKLVFGVAAKTSLLEPGNEEMAAGFRSHVQRVVEDNWPQDVPVPQ